MTGVFERPKDPEFFAQARVVQGAVTWPGELDLAPDAMYDALKKMVIGFCSDRFAEENIRQMGAALADVSLPMTEPSKGTENPMLDCAGFPEHFCAVRCDCRAGVAHGSLEDWQQIQRPDPRLPGEYLHPVVQSGRFARHKHSGRLWRGLHDGWPATHWQVFPGSTVAGCGAPMSNFRRLAYAQTVFLTKYNI